MGYACSVVYENPYIDPKCQKNIYVYPFTLSHVDTGEVISEKDRCRQCQGSKVSQEKKVLEVHIEKGMKDSQKIVFEGQADEAVCPLNMLIF